MGSTIALLLRHNPFLGWPGLEDASPIPRGILRSARSSPGHPTQISDDVEALPSNPMHEARHSNIPRAADRQCFMNTYLFPADKDATAALADIEADVWKTLFKAADDSMAAWRLPCLATQSCNGCNQRTVVLRGVDIVKRRLLFHTDVRSGKVFEISEYANVSLLFYDPEIKVQVVAQGVAAIHTDGTVADRLWNDSAAASLKMYLGELPPGTITPEPSCNEPEFVRGRIPERNEIAAGRCNFAAVVVSIFELEWLQLSRDGNLRARFVYGRDEADSGCPKAQWITP